MTKKRIFLIILAIILFIIALESPQGMIFPMWITIYLLKGNLIKILDKISLPIVFIGAWTIFWLLTELFAVIENVDVEYGERILMSQNLVTDMLLAPAFYTLFIVYIYLLVKKYKFTQKSIFIMSGTYWILAENWGAIFLSIFINPIIGIPMSFIIMSVYAVFPLLIYMLTEHRFKSVRPKPWFKTYILLIPIFFSFWAIFWNITLPIFKLIFWE